MRLSTLARLWFPLAVSFELMMLEGPAIQSVMGRLPNTGLNLAAFGLTLSLSLIIESPVIMLISTAIALVDSEQAYRALRRFTIQLAIGCTIVSGLVAYTPLFDFVASKLMGQPAPIIEAARTPLKIMLIWAGAIAWRRFYQGILVRYKQTRKVSFGTAIRLLSAVLSAFGLMAWGRLPGAQVAAWTLEIAVVTEAIATTLFALPLVRQEILHLPERAEPLTAQAIWKFHTPLAATTLLTLLAQPLTAAALARLAFREQTLAAWPVAYMVLLVIRGWGLSLQEITIAQARHEEARPTLYRFAWIVGGVTSAFALLIVITPLLAFYSKQVLRLSPILQSYVFVGVMVGLFMPLTTSLGSWARGILVFHGNTKSIYRGMGINLTTHVSLLILGVVLKLPGMWVAAVAFTVAAVVEYLYLLRRVE